jgi:hypothetical protein
MARFPQGGLLVVVLLMEDRQNQCMRVIKGEAAGELGTE